jgi:hypothetical protein
MSADNWTTCPRCKAKAEADDKGKIDAAAKAYGKVSAEEYEKLVADARSPAQFDTDTLREDYEIGVHNGEFSVSYGCSCNVCGFKFSFKHEEKVKVPDAP